MPIDLTARLGAAMTLCMLAVGCGGGGGGGGGGASAVTPFPTASEDVLPSGQRIDVSFLTSPGQVGDTWTYQELHSDGSLSGNLTQTVIAGVDANGRFSVSTDDGSGPERNDYLVTAEGIYDPQPLGPDAPAAATSVVGAMLDYPTPLYPIGSTRRHVRSGNWGADLDGDGRAESFRFEYSQMFLGFESTPVSGSSNLATVLHFRNVTTLTWRPTKPGLADYSISTLEESWYAPSLGTIKAVGLTTDSTGAFLLPSRTYVLVHATVSGATWSNVPAPVVLDGTVVDIPLPHNALVYDRVRNRYYASVPASAGGSGNRIATIDPASGSVAYSDDVGTEPGALAISGDPAATALYVALDGSREVARLALPFMTEQGRASLPTSGADPLRAERLAVSPVDPDVVAIALARFDGSARQAGVALLRSMVLEPVRTPPNRGSSLIAFDATGTKVFGVDVEDASAGLRRLQVLPDGLAEEAAAYAASALGTRALGVAGGRVFAGAALYDSSGLTKSGSVAGAADCWMRSNATPKLLCLTTRGAITGHARLLIADPDKFAIENALLYSMAEPENTRRELVQGPADQVAISYTAAWTGAVSMIRLFSSTKLASPPPPATVSWPLTSAITADGQALDVGIVHNRLVYDASPGRGVYYATVPGSVIGAGNSIAIISPSNGQVVHSAPIGSEPNAMALAADGSALYVGLDGSGEVIKLALPALTEQARVRLPAGSFGPTRAWSLAVSPSDPDSVAVAMSTSGGGGDGGAGLLRNMVLQPARIPAFNRIDRLAFEPAGSLVYGLNTTTSEFGLRRIGVLPDGLLEQATVTAAGTGYGGALSYAHGRIFAGAQVFEAPAMSLAGSIPGVSGCVPARGSTELVCRPGLHNVAQRLRLLLADSVTLVLSGSAEFATTEADDPNGLVLGPPDQAALTYPSTSWSQPKIRLFTSVKLP